MRSGFNVSLIDGEWWTRSGLKPPEVFEPGKYEGCADISFWWMISNNQENIVWLANPWYVVRFFLTNGTYSHAYAPADSSATMTFDTGSKSGEIVMSGSVEPNIGDMLMRGTGFTREVRLIEGVPSGGSGTWQINLYRPWTSPGVSSESVRLVQSIVPAYVERDDGSGLYSSGGYYGTQVPAEPTGTFGLLEDGPIAVDTGGAVLFEQLVGYDEDELEDASADVPFSHPAIVKGRPYLIITSKFGYPVAVDMADSSVALIQNFFRNTAPLHDAKIAPVSDDPSTGDGEGRGEYCAVAGNRLFIGKTYDDQGRWPLQTFWVSRYGDFTQWHIGLKGKNAKGSYTTLDDYRNQIMNLGSLGNSVVIHREYSQDTAILRDSQRNPVSIVRGMRGYGLVNSRSLVITNRGHYLWTQIGPAVYDGTNLAGIGQDMRRQLESMCLYGNLERNLTKSSFRLKEREGVGPLFGFEDPNRKEIVWVSKNAIRHPKAIDPPISENTYEIYDRQWNYSRMALCYQWETGAFTFKDIPTPSGAGTRYGARLGYDTFLLTCDGYVYDWSEEGNILEEPLDTHELGPSGRTTRAVSSYVETGWMNLGSDTRKALQHVYIEFRPWTKVKRDSTGVWVPLLDSILYELDDAWLSNDDIAIQLAQLQVYADQDDPDGVRSILDNEYTTGKMRAFPTEEFRQPARMIFERSPRVNGHQFKIGFLNEPRTSGVERAPFRIAGIELIWEDTGGGRGHRFPASKR